MGLSLFVVATRTAMIAHRRACPRSVGRECSSAHGDKPDPGWRGAVTLGGEIDRHIETVIKFRSEGASVAPTDVS